MTLICFDILTIDGSSEAESASSVLTSANGAVLSLGSSVAEGASSVLTSATGSVLSLGS